VVPVTDGPDLRPFDCGVPPLNDYLKLYAGQNHRSGVASTFVLVLREGAPTALGYHSLSMAQVEYNSLPNRLQKGLPRYPVPSVRLARFAVDLKWQAKGLGEILLVDAIQRSVAAARNVAAIYMLVNAKDDQAVKFYHHYGFEPIDDGTRTLLAPLDTLRRLFER